MKLVKNIVVVACAASFMFAGVGFHMANSYGDLDADVTATTSYGMTWDLNGSTAIGVDSEMGMLFYFSVPFGVTLRMGWDADYDGDAASSVGLGFTWWSGGEGFRTSIGTSYDYIRTNTTDTDGSNLAVTVGFGF